MNALYAQAMKEVSKIDALNFQGDGMLWVKYLHGCFEWIEWPCKSHNCEMPTNTRSVSKHILIVKWISSVLKHFWFL